ncbi:hypothetical protein RHMOL_Rhmol04G0203400 [Rhododendron molle]|uniref:Uncharacterized protein n=1 Tax=Rhododendron molle TaxID=49168 RepID=A0ACC0P501_RHOML|nr:hypothetical protein RHMOL_Rhmol04G0203400 [Rhododendron molle]
MGLNDELIAQLFQRTLTGSALDWFLTLEFVHYHTWPKIANTFVKQYAYDVQIKLTTQDLEMTKQESSEDFVTFLARWREKAAKIKIHPSEEDQVRIVVNNLRPKYLKHIYTQSITDFKRLHATRLQIEEGIKLGLIGKEEAPPPKKSFPTRTSHASINTLDPALPQDPFQASSAQNSNCPRRNFNPLYMTLSQALTILSRQGHLKPLNKPPPQPPYSPNHDPSKQCAYHQLPSHDTDSYMRLRQDIQDLIDSRTIKPPQPDAQAKSPHNVEPPRNINLVNLSHNPI